MQRCTRHGIVLVLVLMLVPAALPALVAASDRVPIHVGADGDGYGFNVWGLNFDAGFRARVVANVRDAGFGWVRQQVIWSAMEPERGNFGTDFSAQLDLFVNDASARG